MQQQDAVGHNIDAMTTRCDVSPGPVFAVLQRLFRSSERVSNSTHQQRYKSETIVPTRV